MTTTTLQFSPYIFFYGRCEEALDFYKSAIGGTYEMQRFEGSPMAEGMPAGDGNKVMHSTFKGPGFTFMASDGPDTKKIDPETGNITLCLTAPDAAEGERVFNALSNGGKVKVAFSDAPWGAGKFGVFDDRFGIEWMVTAD
ncbi:MAG TPA: VOC family protein [Candidatus Baltobacteraceae bacterium]